MATRPTTSLQEAQFHLVHVEPSRMLSFQDKNSQILETSSTGKLFMFLVEKEARVVFPEQSQLKRRQRQVHPSTSQVLAPSSNPIMQSTIASPSLSPGATDPPARLVNVQCETGE